ncbi:MFS transporter [Kutzneria sp. NPDC052558]|uniref:MFS transporter n=1 Tax=Kutzneria sp. NPDC052558 TaxID=3364121 RepID=UPI0037CA81F1
MNNDRASDGVLAAIRATPVSIRYLLGGMLLNQLGAFVQSFLLLYLVHRGVSAELAGIGLVAYAVGAIVGTMLGGELAHRVGTRVTIGLAMAASGPLVALIPLLGGPNTFWLVVLDVGLAGLVTQAYRPAASVLLAELMPEKFQVMGFSMMRIALNAGAAGAALLATVFISVNWDLLFYVDGVTALLYSLLAFSLLPNVVAPAEEEPAPGETASRGSAYAVLARDGRFLMYLAAVFIGTLVYAQYTVALPLKIVADGLSTDLYSFVLATSGIVLITCELKITSYIVKWPPSLAVFLGHVVFGLAFLGWGLSAGNPAVVIVSAALFTGGLMMSGPTMFARPAKVPARYRARYLGVNSSIMGLAQAVGPAIGVVAWAALGNAFFPVLTVFAVITGALAWAGIKVKPEPKTESVVTSEAVA